MLADNIHWQRLPPPPRHHPQPPPAHVGRRRRPRRQRHPRRKQWTCRRHHRWSAHTYDRSVIFWGPDGPGGADRTRTFIVSHTVPDDVPANGVCTFVTSPEVAVAAARAAAGERPIDVFSPSIGRQLLQAGLVSELRLHVSPVVLGGGTHLFEGVRQGELELLETRPSAQALHLHYAIR